MARRRFAPASDQDVHLDLMDLANRSAGWSWK
jgi:hypothetical protein